MTPYTLSDFLAGAMVQRLKLPAGKVGDCAFEPRSDQVTKKQNVSSPLTQYCEEPP